MKLADARNRLLIAGVLAFLCGCQGQAPTGDAARGESLYTTSVGAIPSCLLCHCADASGGCRMDSPDIRGQSFVQLAAVLRDTVNVHPGGVRDLSDQEIADLAAYLGSFNGAPKTIFPEDAVASE
ncbi:MAG: cytochrome c [Phycisphaerales bacterium]|nr:MAG: cytochrome c [Phycisphaerales bacterium]